tara:strand:- start:391 stop:588 length:198 start_codon:yes stop_codon:yes gene_type:complete
MSKKTYTLLVSRSTGIYYDVEAHSKDEAIDTFNNGEDAEGNMYTDVGWGEYEVDSFVVDVTEKKN